MGPLRSVRPAEDEAHPDAKNLASWNWLAGRPEAPEACEAGGADDPARALLAAPAGEEEPRPHLAGARGPGGAPRRRGCTQCGGAGAAAGVAVLLAASCLYVRGAVGPAAPPGRTAGAGGLASVPREFEAPTPPSTTRLLAAGYSTTHGKNASDGIVANKAKCERCPVGECDTAGGDACPFFEPPEKGYHCRVASCREVPDGSACWEWEGHSFYSFRDKDAPCLEAGKKPGSAPPREAAPNGSSKAVNVTVLTDQNQTLNVPTAEKEAKEQAQKRNLLAMKEKELGQALGNALDEALRMEKESPTELEKDKKKDAASSKKSEPRSPATGVATPKRALGQSMGRGVVKASTSKPAAPEQASTAKPATTSAQASAAEPTTTSELASSQASTTAEATTPAEDSTTADEPATSAQASTTAESTASEQARAADKTAADKETFDLFAPSSTAPGQASTTVDESTTSEQASTAAKTTKSKQASTTAHATTSEQASTTADSTTSEQAGTTMGTTAAKRALSAPPGTTRAATTTAPPEIVDKIDVRLTSYWDVFSCGPAGDDHNSDWCGGNTHAPECKDVVETDVCASGKARLKSLRGRDGESNFLQDQCLYVFFAQYVCEAQTSTSTLTTTTSTTSVTSTSTRTNTSTRTTTTSATNTTTVTTTTTVVTTTAVWEGKLLKATEELEASLLKGEEWSADAMLPDDCDSQWKPPDAPQKATDLNGIHLPDVCFRSKGPHRVFVIGDWGGVLGDAGPKPANQRPEENFVYGVDDSAQVRVANQMAVRANITNPDYVLNAGDNFYWGGLEVACGIPAWTVVPLPQFEWNFEKVYEGPGLTGKPWLGVLGNHDYGGFAFMKGWDQLIAYTWGPGGRWVMPAQYYRSVVRYPGFSVDYFFMDTNVNNAAGGNEDVHNICSSVHNPPDASCGEEGPIDVASCPDWFSKLWEDQQKWVDKGLAESTADWQVVVTHYPPTWNQEFWVDISRRHGVDLFVTGHIHSQNLHHLEDGNFLSPTAWIVSGGGGGITSEASPDPEGNDDQYGFYELTLSKEVIQIQGFSHGGFKRSETFLKQRHPEPRSHHGDKKPAVKKAAPAKDDKSPTKPQEQLLHSKTLKKKVPAVHV